jgi:hypothetical protein
MAEIIQGWMEMHDGKMMAINPRGGPMIELDFRPGYRLIGPHDKLIHATPEFVAALKAVVWGFGEWLNPDDHRDELAVLQRVVDVLTPVKDETHVSEEQPRHRA